jgi:Secretion system C-terminal sorting domain
MFDLLGKKVYAESYVATIGGVKTISTLGLAKGVYSINITSEGKMYHSKLVIQ